MWLLDRTDCSASVLVLRMYVNVNKRAQQWLVSQHRCIANGRRQNTHHVKHPPTQPLLCISLPLRACRTLLASTDWLGAQKGGRDGCQSG